jgi:carboxypeptidase PM20D1
VHRLLLRHPRLLELLGSRALPANPVVASMLTEACALTVLDSGYKSNVVPGRARAVLSLRLLPGTRIEDAVARVRALVRDPAVDVRPWASKPATASAFDTEDFSMLACGAGAGLPTATVSPVLSPGASDARHWRAAGVTSYGWVPFAVPVADILGVHGRGERLAVEAFHDGVRRYCRTVTELACQPQPDHHGEDLRS